METFCIVLMGMITICAYISYFPQIYRLMKKKHSGDLSITTWSIAIYSDICGTVYSILIQRYDLLSMYASKLVLATIILVLILVYRKNK
jgi:uncharacterized protein with PQ loop repeat